MRTQGNSGNKKVKAEIKVVLFFLLVVMIINAGVFFNSFISEKKRQSETQQTVYYEVVSSEIENDEEVSVNRTPLDEGLCKLSQNWYEIPDSFGLSEKQLDRIKEGMYIFYQRTGVQPYVIFSDTVNGIYSDSVADKYLEERYNELFEDEGHMIILYGTDVFKSGVNDYKRIYIGVDAQTVIDESARSILYAKKESYFNDTQGFTAALYYMFTEAAKEIMELQDIWVEEPENDYEIIGNADNIQRSFMDSYVTFPMLMIMGACVAAAIILGVLLARIKIKRDAREMDYYEAENKNRYSETQENDGEPSISSRSFNGYKSYQSYPVTCPNCRATAYLTENGCCQYCGKKLK